MPHPLILDETVLQEHGLQLAAFLAALRKAFVDETESLYMNREYGPNYRSPVTLKKDNAFHISNESLREMIGMSNFQLRNCKKLAVQKGYLRIDIRDIPGKPYYLLLDTHGDNT